MKNKEEIFKLAHPKGTNSADVARRFNVSRQQASATLRALVAEGKLVRVGVTRGAFYVPPAYAESHPEVFPNRYLKTFLTAGLEEHRVFEEIERKFARLATLPENVLSVFRYAFSEMLNNAIEHSQSGRVAVEVAIERGQLTFTVADRGVGAFRNIMERRHLPSELAAIQDLLKGKVTTMPQSHSGEGIFFTSRVADRFEILSFEYRMAVDAAARDTFVGRADRVRAGTSVSFRLAADSNVRLADVFARYTDSGGGGSLAFDATEAKVKLYDVAGVAVSRSQARRLLADLERFKVVTLDFSGVPMVGQAFADEIFRVFHAAHPSVTIRATNMNDAVAFMVGRVEGWAGEATG